MTKISSKTAYPKKKPISSDYFVGTDSEDFNKTVNFGFEEVAGLVNDLNGTPILNYVFSTSPYLSTEVLLEGRFLSDENELSTPSLTKLYINKFNNSGDNLQELYLFLQTNATDFYLKLRNSNNQNNAVYFDIASIEDFADYFILNITVFKENEFLPLLENLNVYFFDFELKATSAGISDPLKLDKDGYTGTAKDIDDRVIALESLQNLSTNFIGQAYAVWTGEGLIYDVIYPNYYIEGVSYFGATDQITLDAADPTNPRQDVIAVDVTGAIKKTGIASPDPAAPSVDTQTEIYISTIFIGAGATTPTGVSNTDIYKENVEFATSTDLGTVNFNSTTFPFSGTKCIDIGAFTPTKYLRFSGVDSLEISDFSSLQLFLYLKASFATTARLAFRFINGTTPVSSTLSLNNNQFNYNRTVVQVYQNIVIPISAFTFWSGTFTGIEIFTEGNNASGCKIDNISLQTGGAFSSPKQKALTSIITDSGVANATTEDDTFQFKGSSGLGISAIGKIITFTSNFTAALKANYDAAHTWVSTNGANVMSHLSRTDNPHSVTKSQVGLSNVENTSDLNKPVSTAQQAALDLKLNTADYNQHYKGTFLTEAALNATHPTANVGDYAQVNEAGGTDVVNYSWDAEENIWVAGGGTGGAANTDALPEGSTNLYWTVARFLANLTAANIKAALGITTLSGDNTGDQDLSNLVVKNTTITAGTNTKITYDTKGLVTGGASLLASDIPTLNQNTTGTASTITGSISESQVTNLVTDLSNKQSTSQKNTANGYAGLGSDGKLIASQLPSITISDTFVTASQAAMLALTAETGDVAVRTDLNKSFILKGANPAVLADWQELLTPTSAVTTVFGRNGAVTAQTGDYTADQVTETATRKFQTANQKTFNDATSSIQTQLNGKQNNLVSGTNIKTIEGQSLLGSGNIDLAKSDVGLSNVDNTSDSNKPISTATQTALDGKQAALGFTPENLANKSDSYTASSSTTYASTKALVDGLGTKIGGTLTSGYIPKATSANSLGNSLIYDNGTNVGIGTSTPLGKFDIRGGTSQFTHTTNDWTSGSLGSYLFVAAGANSGNTFYQIGAQTGGGSAWGNLVLQSGGGNVLIGTSTDNGIGRVQVNGTISATGGTTANQVVVKSQLDGKVSLTGNETVAGIKTFSSGILLNSLSAASSDQLTLTSGSTSLIIDDYSSTITAGGDVKATAFIRTTSLPGQLLKADGNVTVGYKVYTALLSQTGTSAPTATVLENTLGGSITWTRVNPGIYSGTLTGAFTTDKTILLNNNPVGGVFTNIFSSVNTITIQTRNYSNAQTDDGLSNTSIEIRVYN